MYSVEDLLISHGYKLSKHTTSSTPTPVPTPSSHQPPPSSPPSYSKHHEVLESRPCPRTVNGYERGPVVTFGSNSSTRPPQVPNKNNESGDGSQAKPECENRRQTDTHSLGESLASDSGFCDSYKVLQTKDVSYWRRRGQDFSVLLDYTDIRDPRGRGQGECNRPEGSQQARGQEIAAKDCHTVAQERQHWVAQTQAIAVAQAKAQAVGRSKEREAALYQWRMASERKGQILETEDWHPAVNFTRQMSQRDGEHWAQEQQRLQARTPEGMVIHSRTKAKSQSLPRVLQPESLQYVDMALSGQELYRKVNGHPPSHQNFYRSPRWPENGRPASATQLSTTPKPRFTRPPRPPSYEMHQQIRGSCEILSGRESAPPQARDRTPLPISRTKNSQLEYFGSDSGPPGYIPPPSYKRAPIMGGGFRGYGQIPLHYRYRGDMHPQIQVAPDGSHWFIRHPASFWPDVHKEERSQKQFYPVYLNRQPFGGGLQYISFDDPRIRHISSAFGGNSLTDADKIRHIRNELPSVPVSEPARTDSAFLPPPLGPFVSSKLTDKTNQASSRHPDNANKRWQSDLHKQTVNSCPAPDENCNHRHLKIQHSPSTPSPFQALLTTSCHKSSISDQVFAETITQVKKIVPVSEPENNRNTKRRVSETIFCLVSVPVHTPADPNNNDEKANLTVTKSNTFAVGLKESPNIRSKSVNEMPINRHYSHFHTSSTSSMRNYKRAPLRKEVLDAWVLHANKDRELSYTGSWPGNQYRNQETQTGSPIAIVKSPEFQDDVTMSASDRTADDDDVRTECVSYGYPMSGQKNLHPSSNSAFSRLSLIPTLNPPLHNSRDGSSPSRPLNQGQFQSLSSRKNSPPESTEQLVFGQFLLKPVNRRPCDVIGELETINKEMEDAISKRPTFGRLNKTVDGVDGGLTSSKSGAHFTVGPEPGREAISLPPLHTQKPNQIKKRSKSFASSADLESMEISTSVSKPQNNTPRTFKLPIHTDQGQSESSSLPSGSSYNKTLQLYRQDIPVPQESLFRDVGLTVYTETPGGPGEPVQRSLSVPPLLCYKNYTQTLTEPSLNVKHISSEKPYCKLKLNAQPESCLSPEKDCLQNIKRHTVDRSYESEEVDRDERYSLSEPLTYKNDSTVADKHLESLLIKEKANILPTEDLSNLYVVQSAKGIPENESIEDRAARILGIAVPVEALCVADEQSTDKQHDAGPGSAQSQTNTSEGTQLLKECAEMNKKSMLELEADQKEETGLSVNTEEDQEVNRAKHSIHHCDGGVTQDTETPLMLDLPEFPPTKLLLSLPVTPHENVCVGREEKKGKGSSSKVLEYLADKPSPSADLSSSTLSNTERESRLKELDSVSRIRYLSLKSPEFVGECDSKERDDSTAGCEAGQYHERVLQEEPKRRTKEEENNNNHEDLEETDVIESMCTGKQRNEEEKAKMVSDVPLHTSGSAHAQSQLDKEDTKIDLETEENAEHFPEIVKDNANTAAESAHRAEGEKLPIPKQRTKLHKPPLLPKPRSVPKREITLPLSIGTGTSGAPSVEDQEALSASDSYDPSRVERV